MWTSLKSLLASRKTWTAISTAITAAALKVGPLLALWLGWDQAKVVLFQAAASDLANLVVALGGLIILAIGVEDAGAKISLPSPSANAPPAITIINPQPAGEAPRK